MKLEERIEHTMLKPEATKETVIRYCKEAIEHGFCSVCVNSCNVPLVSEQLKGSSVKVCAVVGFPLGAMATRAKAYECEVAVEEGADEIDMVMNVGALKSGEDMLVLRDMEAVKKAAKGRVVKVILETCLLTDEEKRKACRLAMKAGLDYVKTSTGFSSGGATVHDVQLMKEEVNGKMKIKASGGIRSKEQAMALVEAGADRLGVGNGLLLL